jgi:hypothetical protein
MMNWASQNSVMEQQTFSYFISPFLFSFFIQIFFSFFETICYLLLLFLIRPQEVKALGKPTEQPIEQRYASLVGKVPTQYIERL